MCQPLVWRMHRAEEQKTTARFKQCPDQCLAHTPDMCQKPCWHGKTTLRDTAIWRPTGPKGGPPMRHRR